MAEEDQKERTKETPDWDKIDAIDKNNNQEIKNIINEYGFIGIKDYGKEASYKAWLLIQHMPEEDIEFMKKYLKLMEENLDDADKINYALLTDRINVYEGIPQVYGSQTHSEDDESDLEFHPIKNVEVVDKKRREVGLNSLKEYAEWMEETFKQKVILPKGYTLH